MKYEPTRIIVKQSLRYLSKKKRAEVFNLIAQKHLKGKNLLNFLFKHVDLELFKTKPLIKEDILLYNYIKYDIEKKMGRSGLIAKYEKTYYIDDDDEFWKSIKESKQ